MPPKNARGAATRAPNKSQSSADRTLPREETPGETVEIGEVDEQDEADDDVHQPDLMATLQENQNATASVLQLILERLQNLEGNQSPLRTVEQERRSTGVSDNSLFHDKSRGSRKKPDPERLDDGVDPTFLSWKLEIQGKLRVNADHYNGEEDQMLYVFGRTKGDARKHLLPRYDEDSPARFKSVKEMIAHLASIYVNPNRVRDAKYDFSRLLMKPGELFSEFQTSFLHLAGEAQIPQEDLKTDLYDKLTIPLRRTLATNLRSWTSYQDAVADCLSVDTELRRISLQEDRQKRFRTTTALSGPTARAAMPTTSAYAPTQREKTPGPLPPGKDYSGQARGKTPVEPDRPPVPSSVICFKCSKPGHYAASCPDHGPGDLKEIEEEYDVVDTNDEDSGKEDH